MAESVQYRANLGITSYDSLMKKNVFRFADGNAMEQNIDVLLKCNQDNLHDKYIKAQIVSYKNNTVFRFLIPYQSVVGIRNMEYYPITKRQVEYLIISGRIYFDQPEASAATDQPGASVATYPRATDQPGASAVTYQPGGAATLGGTRRSKKRRHHKQKSTKAIGTYRFVKRRHRKQKTIRYKN